jgi:hypothetical protein
MKTPPPPLDIQTPQALNTEGARINLNGMAHFILLNE